MITSLPLSSCCITATNMEASDKKTLYTLIRSLGGEATSTLNTSTNTHLVCVDCSGAKYEEAVRSGIMIVGPEWVKACQVRNERVDEKEFEVDRDIDDDEHQVEDQVEETVNQNCDKGGEKGGNEHSYANPGTLTKILQECVSLLSTVQDREDNVAGQQIFHQPHLFLHASFYFSNVPPLLVAPLSDLIRRHGGTRYWDCTPTITHVLVYTSPNRDSTRVERTFVAHPNGPSVVDLAFVLKSIDKGELCDVEKFRLKKPAPKPVLAKPVPQVAEVEAVEKVVERQVILKALDSSYVVCLTGFTGEERAEVEANIVKTGAAYTGTLTRENTHLICKIKGGAKYERAVEWGIEIVDDGWLFEDDVKKREEYEERERERAAEVKRVETERNLEMLKKLESSTVRSSKKLRRQREGSSGGAGSMLPPPKKVVRRTESPKSESPQKRSNPTDYEEDAVEGSQFISWRN